MLLAVCLLGSPVAAQAAGPVQVQKERRDRQDAIAQVRQGHAERKQDAPGAAVPHERSPGMISARGEFVSVQVNVDENGMNIVGDAGNEPSLAVDPNNPNKIAIGWRQFDTINNNFRQAGNAYSADGGASWNNNIAIDPGVFRSDPVLEYAADGTFYYYSLTTIGNDFVCDMYLSDDGGQVWNGPFDAGGGDKQWMTVDRSGGIGDGNVYGAWSPFFSCCDGFFNRSTDGGFSYIEPIEMPSDIFWGTLSVGPDGELYVCGVDLSFEPRVLRSDNAQNAAVTPTFPQNVAVSLGGVAVQGGGPNPGGLLGQFWVATDHSDGPTRGNVYLLGSVNPPGSDPLDAKFSRSTDGGLTWSPTVRVNDDALGSGRYSWFGTMSVAPNGRIDVIFNDTRNDTAGLMSELFYTSSSDGGETWTPNIAVSQPFNPFIGWPNQSKIGDYYDMISHDDAVHIAYAATFNGEQDVYYLRIQLAENNAVVADEFDIVRGALVGGGLADLAESDDQRLMVNAGITLQQGEPPLWLVFEGTASTDTPSELSFTLEARNNSGNAQQQIELFNFQSGQYEIVDIRAATGADSAVTITPGGNPARFVEPQARTVRAQVTYRANGIVLVFPWRSDIDQVGWTVVP